MSVDRINAALDGRYLIDHEIGQGGMATVYMAHDLRHDRKVAMKVVHPDLAAVLGADRFLTEIRVTANLQHPNILPLFDSGAADGMLFYVMPLVEGETLRKRLDRERQLPLDDALQIAREVAAALEYAHKHGVIHRDIKPENILLQDGAARVADFGIALAASNAAGARLTQTGLSLGTPQYMSPEQATGDRTIDGRTDVYSLAAVLYEMLAGEPPFVGPSPQAIVARILTEPVRSIRPARESVPPHVETAILKALSRLPADRFATPMAFADALRVQGDAAFRAQADSTRSAARILSHSRVWPIATALALTGCAFLGWRLSRTGRATNELQLARQLTFDGTVIGAAISADGAWLAYVTDDCLGKDHTCTNTLQVREVDGTTSVRIARRAFISPDVKWTPDGSQILF